MDRFRQHRYVVKFTDGGAAMRWYDDPLDVGTEIRELGTVYRVVELTRPRTATGLGHAHVAPID